MLVRTSIVAAPTRSFCCSLRGVSCTGALTPWHGFEGIADDAFEDDAFADMPTTMSSLCQHQHSTFGDKYFATLLVVGGGTDVSLSRRLAST